MNIIRQYKLHKLGVEIPPKSKEIIELVENIFNTTTPMTVDSVPYYVFFVDTAKKNLVNMHVYISPMSDSYTLNLHQNGLIKEIRTQLCNDDKSATEIIRSKVYSRRLVEFVAKNKYKKDFGFKIFSYNDLPAHKNNPIYKVYWNPDNYDFKPYKF